MLGMPKMKNPLPSIMVSLSWSLNLPHVVIELTHVFDRDVYVPIKNILKSLDLLLHVCASVDL